MVRLPLNERNSFLSFTTETCICNPQNQIRLEQILYSPAVTLSCLVPLFSISFFSGPMAHSTLVLLGASVQHLMFLFANGHLTLVCQNHTLRDSGAVLPRPVENADSLDIAMLQLRQYQRKL